MALSTKILCETLVRRDFTGHLVANFYRSIATLLHFLRLLPEANFRFWKLELELELETAQRTSSLATIDAFRLFGSVTEISTAPIGRTSRQRVERS